MFPGYHCSRLAALVPSLAMPSVVSGRWIQSGERSLHRRTPESPATGRDRNFYLVCGLKPPAFEPSAARRGESCGTSFKVHLGRFIVVADRGVRGRKHSKRVHHDPSAQRNAEPAGIQCSPGRPAVAVYCHRSWNVEYRGHLVGQRNGRRQRRDGLDQHQRAIHGARERSHK